MLFPSEISLESFDFESEINSMKSGVTLEETVCGIFFCFDKGKLQSFKLSVVYMLYCHWVFSHFSEMFSNVL